MENTSIEKIEFKKVRDFGEKINITISFIRQNFKNLFKCLLFIVIPAALISAILGNVYQSIMAKAMMNGNFFRAGFQAIPNGFFPILLGMVLVGLIEISLITSVVYEYIMLYIERGPNFEVKDVWQGVKKSFGRILGSLFLGYFVIIIGCFLLVIPGIYATLPVLLLPVIVVREKLGFFSALGRSFKLISGKWWSTFGLLLVCGIIVVIISYLFAIPFYLISGAKMFTTVASETSPSTTSEILGILASTIYNLVALTLYTLPLTALAFQYFNLVERKESAGLMEKINTVGSSSKKNEGTY